MVLAIVLFTFIAFAFAIIWRPSTILAFAICIYPFEQWAQANSSFFAVNSYAINFALGILTLFSLACVMLRGRNPLNPVTVSMWIWAVLYLLAGLSCIWALDRDISLFLFRYHAPYIITFVALLPLVIQDRQDVRIGLIASLFFGTLVMTMLLLSTDVHAWGRTINVAQGATVTNRVGGTSTRLSALSVAEMAGQIALIAILMNFAGVGRIWTLLRWLVVFVAMALIYRSGSRGQFIAMMICLIVFMPPSRGTKQVWGWITAVTSTVFAVSIATFTYTRFANFKQRWSLDTMSDTLQSTRIDYCIKLLTFWSESSPFHWLFGVGSSSSYDPRIIGVYPHVLVVEVLGELGVVGLILLTLFMIFVCRDGYYLYTTTKKSSVDRGVVVTLLALFFFQVILTFKERSFLTHTFTFGCGLIISRYASVMRQYSKQRARSMKAWYANQYAATWNRNRQMEPAATSSS